MKALTVQEQAVRPESVEMARVWIAEHGLDPSKSIDLLRDAYIEKLASPTSEAEGGFVPGAR